MLLKNKNVTQLKKDAWKLFSIWIRQREANWKGQVRCVTCSKTKHWKEGDAGHFVPGRGNSILFDERGVHFQCKQCNGPKGSNHAKYYEFMLRTYGQETVNQLYAKALEQKKFTKQELIELIGTLRERIKKLC